VPELGQAQKQSRQAALTRALYLSLVVAAIPWFWMLLLESRGPRWAASQRYLVSSQASSLLSLLGMVASVLLAAYLWNRVTKVRGRLLVWLAVFGCAWFMGTWTSQGPAHGPGLALLWLQYALFVLSASMPMTWAIQVHSPKANQPAAS
jgi:hypothetical protein